MTPSVLYSRLPCQADNNRRCCLPSSRPPVFSIPGCYVQQMPTGGVVSYPHDPQCSVFQVAMSGRRQQEVLAHVFTTLMFSIPGCHVRQTTTGGVVSHPHDPQCSTANTKQFSDLHLPLHEPPRRYHESRHPPDG